MRDTRDVKATGLQGDADLEIIEILDDDVGAFGDRPHNVTIHDTGGPRWVGPVAAAALVALLGYGIATSASSGAPKVTPSPSTTAHAPASTLPNPTTTTEPPPPVPYYAADPPRAFSIQYADLQPLSSNYYGPGKYKLWATAGATATSGSWFSIETVIGGSSSIYATNAYRVQSGEQSIAISHMPTGQSVAQFSVQTPVAVTLTSFGWSDEDLVGLAQSFTAEGNDVTLADPSAFPDYQLISSVTPWLAVQGMPIEQIYYASKDDVNGGFALGVSPRQDADQGGATLDRQIALRFLLDRATPFDVDGHVAVAGTVIGIRDYALASWIAGDHIVTISGYMSVPELIALARTVHTVTKDQWDGMQFQAARHASDNNFGDFEQSPMASVAFGTDTEANPWTIDVSIYTLPNQQQVTWQWNGNGFGSTAEAAAQINTVVEGQRTYVLADLPRAVAPTGHLQITRAGLDPVMVPFNDISAEYDRTFAAYAFSEATQFTAQILGADGAVLASWPS
ncbi:MAG: hypothetical protein ABI894_17415 [Ilumatobacteraceae bacterium]